MAKTSAATPGKRVAPIVAADGPAGGQTHGPGAGATATVVKHGGNRGGKPRADGLVPGSQEALEADRDADRLRKQITRANAAAAQAPSPIPSVHGQPQAPGAPLVPGPGGLAAPYNGPAPPVPWTADMLKNICGQMIGACETLTANQLLDAALKVGMPEAVIEEMKLDGDWPALSKEALIIALPELCAKWLNKAGISSEYRFELMVGGAALGIGQNHLAQLRRIKLWARDNPDKRVRRDLPAAAAPERKAA
jgi:hypothetical protein